MRGDSTEKLMLLLMNKIDHVLSLPVDEQGIIVSAVKMN